VCPQSRVWRWVVGESQKEVCWEREVDMVNELRSIEG